jgi:catechol 2,3-dioxygenase-like lactoylglutathione lyase family enzyme
MINGIHAIVYAKDADATRKFLRDVLGLASVDAGRGWLIFALPPAEIAAHPSEVEADQKHELYLMCDDLKATMSELAKKGVEFVDEPSDQPWGVLVTLRVPGGGTMGLYQPKHPVAINLKR